MTELEVYTHEKTSLEAKIIKLRAALDLYDKCNKHTVEFFCILNDRLSDAITFIDRVENIDFSGLIYNQNNTSKN